MLVFDMDGTIADLYGVEGWLTDIDNFNVRPYRDCKPIYNMVLLNQVLADLKAQGWIIAVTTWLSMTGTKEYNREVAKVKKEWLDRYNFPYDEIHCVKYGTTKANCTRGKADRQVLIDDNINVINGWWGEKILAKNKNVISELIDLLK